MYEIFEQLLKERGETFSDIARVVGGRPSTFTDWRAGRYTPKREKLEAIAKHFGVTVEYLTTGKETEKESIEGTKWYFFDETARLAQELHDKPHLRTLCDAERDLSPESAQALTAFIETQLKRERGGEHGE